MSLRHSPRPTLNAVSLLIQLLSPSFLLPWGPYLGWPHHLRHHRSEPWHHPAPSSPACHSLAPSSCLDPLCPVPSCPTHLMHHPASSQASVSPTPFSLQSPRVEPAPPLLTLISEAPESPPRLPELRGLLTCPGSPGRPVGQPEKVVELASQRCLRAGPALEGEAWGPWTDSHVPDPGGSGPCRNPGM